jgi:hypothetical protein
MIVFLLNKKHKTKKLYFSVKIKIRKGEIIQAYHFVLIEFKSFLFLLIFYIYNKKIKISAIIKLNILICQRLGITVLFLTNIIYMICFLECHPPLRWRFDQKSLRILREDLTLSRENI